MNTPVAFPPITPGGASHRFLIRDERWDERFKPGFDQFIVASLAFARPVIKLPVPPARTSNHALFLLTGGTIDLTVGHQGYVVGPQQLAVIPAMQIFSINDISPDAAGFMCFISREMLAEATQKTVAFFQLTGQPVVDLTPAQTDYINAIFARLLAEYAESGGSRTDIIWPYLQALMAELSRAYAGALRAKSDADQGNDQFGERLVQEFMDRLNDPAHYVPPLAKPVSQFADWLNVSTNHLNKVVKASTGQSPSVWVDKRRMLEAKVLLYQSTLSIGQIALELGFGDQASFGKFFRRHAHVSPSAFRRMIDSDEFPPGVT